MSKPEFVYTTYIETSVEKLWQALTDGDFTERYWFGHRVTSDWQVGSAYKFATPDHSVEGTVLRSVAAPQLVDCLLRVAAGQRSVQRANLKTMPSPDRVGTNVLERLTPKELQIVALIAEGSKNKEIALQLAKGVSLIPARGFSSAEAAEAHARAKDLCEKTGDTDHLFVAIWGLWNFRRTSDLDAAGALSDRLLTLVEKNDDVGLRQGCHAHARRNL